MSVELGTCPTCENRGLLGEACHERVCQKRGYHFIPTRHAEKHAAAGRARIDPLIGQVVGDYLVVDIIGAGGFGKVYLVRQLPILTLQAALKVMTAAAPDPTLAATLLKKFEQEAQALAALAHPNIVRLLKYGAHDGAPYLVMEFVADARTLKRERQDLVHAGQRLEHRHLRHILRQTVNGLDAAHRLHIIHRDIKPENIMLQRVAGDDYYVRILDFGLAKFVAERTETSRAMGTPTYMAPEQMTRRNIGPWTDLYAVGVITFELLTGRRPFVGRTQQELLANKLSPDYDPTTRIADLDVPDHVTSFLRRALAREPAERYRSADEYRVAMEAMFERLDADGFDGGQTVDLSELLSDGDCDDELLPEPIATSRAADEDRSPNVFVDDASAVRVAIDGREPSESVVLAQKSARTWMLAAAGLGLALSVVVVWMLMASGTSNSEASGPIADNVGQTSPREEAPSSPGSRGDDAAEVKVALNPPSAPAVNAASPSRPEPSPDVSAAPASAPGEGSPTVEAAPTSVPGAAPVPTPVQPELVAKAQPEVVAEAQPTASEPGAPTSRRRVKLETQPPGAAVYVVGAKLGTTPMEVSWPAGDAPPTIRLVKRGYVSNSPGLTGADDGTTKRIMLVRRKPRPAEPKPPKPVRPTVFID